MVESPTADDKNPTTRTRAEAYDGRRMLGAGYLFESARAARKFRNHSAHRFGLVQHIEVGAVAGDAVDGYVCIPTRGFPGGEVMIGPTAYVDQAKAALRALFDDAGYGRVEISHSIARFR